MAKTTRDRDFNIEIQFAFFLSEGRVKDYIASLPPSPETAMEQGERFPEKNLPRYGLVVYLSRAERWDAPFEEHWENLRNQFWPYRHSIKTFSEACSEVRCTIVIDYFGRFPLLHFPHEFVLFLSSINAALEVDVLDDL